MKNIFWFIVGGVLSIIVMLLLPQSHQKIHYINQPDTITITDTFTEYYPTPVEVVRLKDSLIYLTDTQYVILPFTKKRYTTENYDLTISGFEPQLDEITVYPTTKLIYQTTINEEKKKFQIKHGIQWGFGYGIFNKKVDVWFGYGFQLSF